LITVVISQSITMAEKRLKEPLISGRLLSLFNQQPLTVKVHVLKRQQWKNNKENLQWRQ